MPALEAEGALRLTPEPRASVIGVSAATIDRRLGEARCRARPRGVATTRPGSLLRKQIPVRTYAPWDEQRPGFLEIDLVAHCGEAAAGEYCRTLDAVDVATGWTGCQPVPNRGQLAVRDALGRIRARLPFPPPGIDSDNGAEFIDAHPLRYREAEGVTSTGCRAYRKDDQAHVERKNYTAVRQLVGYDRYGGEEAAERLRRVYALSRLHIRVPARGWGCRC